MNKNKTLITKLLLLFDNFFKKSIFIFYILYFLIFIYYLFLFLNDNFRIFILLDTYFIDKIKYFLEIMHFLLKLSISLYLIIKFNPYLKIKFNNKNDKNIIFNSGILIFTSLILIDPIIYFKNYIN